MHSMTGFGRAAFSVDGALFRIELRSFNSRFLDLKLRLPWPDGELEQRIATAVRERVPRGRVELTLWQDQGPADAAGGPWLDRALATRLAAAVAELSELCGGDRACAAALIGPVPGLVTLSAARPDAIALWQGGRAGDIGLAQALGAALDQLLQMRASEGGALAAALRQQLAELQRLAAALAPLALEEPARRQLLLAGRLAQLATAPVDPQRLAQEVALLAERADVREELDRLQSHFAQLELAFGAHEPIGRRVEFLLQEVHRELNTLAAKAAAPELGVLVLDAKSWLEKMREQAQNIE